MQPCCRLKPVPILIDKCLVTVSTATLKISVLCIHNMFLTQLANIFSQVISMVGKQKYTVYIRSNSSQSSKNEKSVSLNL